MYSYRSGLDHKAQPERQYLHFDCQPCSSTAIQQMPGLGEEHRSEERGNDDQLQAFHIPRLAFHHLECSQRSPCRQRSRRFMNSFEVSSACWSETFHANVNVPKSFHGTIFSQSAYASTVFKSVAYGQRLALIPTPQFFVRNHPFHHNPPQGIQKNRTCGSGKPAH